MHFLIAYAREKQVLCTVAGRQQVHQMAPTSTDDHHAPHRCLGCDDQSCELCMHNPNRKCMGNLGNKYLIEDPLRPRCNAPIFLHLVDATTGDDVHDIEELQVEACIINGVLYDELHAERRDDGQLRAVPTDDVYERMVVAHNKEGAPLLMQRGSTADADPGPVVFELKVCDFVTRCWVIAGLVVWGYPQPSARIVITHHHFVISVADVCISVSCHHVDVHTGTARYCIDRMCGCNEYRIVW